MKDQKHKLRIKLTQLIHKLTLAYLTRKQLDQVQSICDQIRAIEVCEWNDESYGYKTKCGELYFTDIKNQFTYCPYCGKKIKIV